MAGKIKAKIAVHASTILGMYKTYHIEACGDLWKFNIEKQICRDCMESMRRSGLIGDYNLSDFTFTI